MEDSDLNRLIGGRIRRRRRTLGMSQLELGEACHVAYQQIQRYEGGAEVPVDRLWVMAKALEVPISYFFEESA